MNSPRRTATVISVIAAAAGAIAACGSNSHTTRTASNEPHLPAVWGMPPDGIHPRALLLNIHGGGWKGLDRASYQFQLEEAPLFQRLGYETLTFNYRGGAHGVQDAEMFYRFARKRVGPNFPICALGESAGGHIALMLAVNDPDLACVLDLAGPTDLTALAKEPGGSYAHALAVQAFGNDHLAAYSPSLLAKSIRARVMLVYAQSDPVVPVAQGEEMARALPTAKLLVLPPGPTGFVHGAGDHRGVSVASYSKTNAAEIAFLADATRAWRPG